MGNRGERLEDGADAADGILPLSVLLVDDDPEFLAAMKDQLAERCRLVITAKASLKAFWVLEKTQIDVVICDLVLCGTDGLDFLELVRDQWPQTSRILVTGFGERVASARAHPAADAVLIKPFESARLLALLEALPRRREQRRWLRTRFSADALVSAGGEQYGCYEVFDLSAGGALLRGEIPFGVGTIVQVSLRLCGAPAINLDARVVRAKRPDSVAVAFIHDGPDTEDAIHQAILAYLESEADTS